jgi:hypothetical protein
VGDVVKILTNNAAYIECKFIPPKYSTPPTPIVVEGGDYSTSEQAVMVNDGGTVRPKLWVDGKPIYKRTFTGTFTAGTGITSGAWITLPFSVGANNQLIDATLVGQSDAHTESVKVGDLRFRLTDKTTGNILIRTETQYIGITDYVVTVEYTKL